MWGLTLSAAQVVPSLYGAVVSDTDGQQAAQDAMRQVLVRLTGERDAAGDPALAGLVTDARRYVQLQRSTTAGATQVLFDAGALRDALSAAGAASGVRIGRWCGCCCRSSSLAPPMHCGCGWRQRRRRADCRSLIAQR